MIDELMYCAFQFMLTLLMLEMQYPGFGGGNTLPADAPAPKVARASAGMVLAE